MKYCQDAGLTEIIVKQSIWEDSYQSGSELIDFVNEIEFDRLGVFTYSVEENTPAYLLGDPVDSETKEERKIRLMQTQLSISKRINESLHGKEIKVIIDDIEGKKYIGRSEKDAPEVDGEVLIEPKDQLLKIGNFYNVEIYGSNEYDLFGKIMKRT